MTRARLCVSALLGLVVSYPAIVEAAVLQTSVDYGGDGAVMNLYVPDDVDEFPAVVVGLHYCGGAATNAASWFTSLSDQFGFILIAPGLPPGDADGCWDVGSNQSLSHDGGSHSKAIVEMVDYVIVQYGADPQRVYAAGASSGAMLTNVLLGAYPDVFAAGSVLAGVPFSCWTAGDGWTSACADGNTTKSAAEWGDAVRNAFPGYTGPRPRVQLFHGTADTTLNYKNLAEEVKQWTNVLGLSETPNSTQDNTPKSGWTRSNYEDVSNEALLEVTIGEGQAHDLTGQGLWTDVARFFALEVDVEPSVAGPGPTGQGGSTGMGNAGAAGAGSVLDGMPNTGGAGSGSVGTGGATDGSGGVTGILPPESINQASGGTGGAAAPQENGIAGAAAISTAGVGGGVADTGVLADGADSAGTTSNGALGADTGAGAQAAAPGGANSPPAAVGATSDVLAMDSAGSPTAQSSDAPVDSHSEAGCSLDSHRQLMATRHPLGSGLALWLASLGLALSRRRNRSRR